MSRKRLLVLLGGVALAAVIAAVLLVPGVAERVMPLPLLAAFSVSRMVAAYLLSLVFAVAYGYTAAKNRRAGVFMLPLLDILQSVPILGFFPAVLVFFVATFSGHPVGLEIAVVFLIFTSMAWNMAFGVYESLTTIPQDLQTAADSFGIKGWQRFRLLEFPAAVPKLVYNSILSWTNGWFFLVASEIFTAFGATYTRPGLGGFIATAGVAGDTTSMLLGLSVLVVVVVALDAFLWQPLSVWSERFRMEVTGREVPRVPGLHERFRWLPTFPGVRRFVLRMGKPVTRAYHSASLRLDRTYTEHPKIVPTVRTVDLGMFLVVFVIVVGTGLIGLVRLLFAPLPAETGEIPVAVLMSFSRLLLAYALAVLWTIPVAAWIGRSAKVARYVTPVVEVVASVPATALMPVIIGFSIFVAASFHLEAELAAVLVALFSMQWYLLFNLIAGVRSIPDDLEDAAHSFGLRGRSYLKRVLLPAILPSLITGSITAWGAGWNALIVSEYMHFGSRIYQVQGIGSLLDRATFGLPPSEEMILLTIFAMVIVVLAMNKLVWRPLQRTVNARFRLEV